MSKVLALTCLALAACAAPTPAARTASPPAQAPEEAPAREPTTPEPPAEPERASPEPVAIVAPDSPIVLRVSYGNLGTQSGSEWAVHADGAVRGRVCDEPRERQLTVDEVTALRASMERCKLCQLPERHPSGSNADKEIYRVEASWPDLSCKTDVSMQSRFHYDARAKRCHAILEDLLHARVGLCPDQALLPERAITSGRCACTARLR
jgi:hypothetical protein